MTNSSKTLWAGRYEAPIAETLRKLNDSLPYDKRMVAEDIQGSIAYAQALARAGIITNDEAHQIQTGLNAVKDEFDSGVFVIAPGDEDIHTAVERRLSELIGAPAGKLHTGRSRNDQVATDVRLWQINQLRVIQGQLKGLIAVLAKLGQDQAETLMPGYTHLRAAQTITCGHWLMSFAMMLMRDARRLDLCLDSTDSSPLGSGALSGTPYPIDRMALAESMGFSRCTANSLDAVADRDFIVEFLSASALMMVHLSRFAEDVILYSSPQFGFIKLNERFTTGSSLMPQKQNPDALELARGKAGRIAGHLSGLLNTLKGLPSTYNKDMQEDKEPLFDTVETLETLLPAVTGLVETMTFDPARMRAALDEGMLATDVADYLVAKGIPFREAHGIVGRLVRHSLETGIPFSKIPLADFKAIHPIFEEDVYAVFDFAAAAAKRSATGGTAPESVREQVRQVEAWLAAR